MFSQLSSVQLLSRVRLFATSWITAHQASLPITNSGSLPKFMPIESVIPSSHLILCRPLLLLPPIPPSIPAYKIQKDCFFKGWKRFVSFIFPPLFILLDIVNRINFSCTAFEQIITSFSKKHEEIWSERKVHYRTLDKKPCLAKAALTKQ